MQMLPVTTTDTATLPETACATVLLLVNSATVVLQTTTEVNAANVRIFI